MRGVHRAIQSTAGSPTILENIWHGLGLTALSALTRPSRAGLHHTPRAKRVIFLFMAGAPSQLDLFDYKPDLDKLFGEPVPESVTQGQRVTAMTRGRKKVVAPSMYRFERQGEGGVWWCELFPFLSSLSDKICIIKSLHTNAINHDPAKTFVCTGSEIPGKASLGAWLSYGLGSMNRDLPDFVVLTSAFWTGGTRNVQGLYSRLWGSGFLPSSHQGVAFQTALVTQCCSLSNPRPASTRQDATALVGSDQLAEVNAQATTVRSAIPEIQHHHRAAGAGVPHAGLSPGVHRPEPANRHDGARAVRPRGPQARLVCAQLPARATDGRARRALHAVVPPRLGPSLDPADGSSPASVLTSIKPSAALLRRSESSAVCSTTPSSCSPASSAAPVFGQGKLERDRLRARSPPALFRGDGSPAAA